MRASNVDAALYYLARMVEAGQDPLYIARRMVVFASEDVTSPTALVVAEINNPTKQTCKRHYDGGRIVPDRPCYRGQ